MGIERRFWTKVNIQAPEDCWEWERCLTKQGYGSFYMGKAVTASRVAWTLTNGEIPPGLHVLHHCDNKKCCNPKHLFLGTNLDNIADKTSKYRGASKLTSQMVESIRKDTNPQVDISRRYGISKGMVSKIKSRSVWCHLEES